MKIDVLYLTFPNMTGVVSALSNVEVGTYPFFENSMSRSHCQPIWGVMTKDAYIDEWLEDLKGRDTRLYLSVSFVEENDRPLWCGGKGWYEILKELRSRAEKVVIINQTREAFVYDGIMRGGRPEELAEQWLEVSAINNTMSSGAMQVNLDDLSQRRTIQKLHRYLGVRLNPINRRIRNKDDIMSISIKSTKEKPKVEADITNAGLLDKYVRRREMFNDLNGGDLAFVAVYFNVCEFSAPYENIKRFLKRFEWMGDRLLVVELAFFDQDFVLTGLAPNVLQLRGDTVLWQKEALINAGTKVLRDHDYKNVGWLDGDTILDTDGEIWFSKCVEKMESSQLIQVFETGEHKFADKDLVSLGCVADIDQAGTVPDKAWKTGIGWAMRGDMWDEFQWYDYSITGSGDRLQFLGAVVDDMRPWLHSSPQFQASAGYMNSFIDWADKYYRSVDGKIGYVKGVAALGEEHGTYEGRQYYDREFILKETKFDPNIHLERDTNGLHAWSSEAPQELIDRLMNYFEKREEDG